MKDAITKAYIRSLAESLHFMKKTYRGKKAIASNYQSTTIKFSCVQAVKQRARGIKRISISHIIKFMKEEKLHLEEQIFIGKTRCIKAPESRNRKSHTRYRAYSQKISAKKKNQTKNPFARS